jgi:hypothetical protein
MGKINILFKLKLLKNFFSVRMIYSSASRTLCLQNEINRTRAHTSRIFIEISTSNTELIHYSLQLENITEFLIEYE